MPGPSGNFDDVILQALLQQGQGGGRAEQAGMPPEQLDPTMAGAADVYSYGNGMGAQAGMPTPQQAQASNADMQQAQLLKQALKQMRAGK